MKTESEIRNRMAVDAIATANKMMAAVSDDADMFECMMASFALVESLVAQCRERKGNGDHVNQSIKDAEASLSELLRSPFVKMMVAVRVNTEVKQIREGN